MKKWLLVALLTIVPTLAVMSPQTALAATKTDATQINATVEGENIFDLTVNGATGTVETYTSPVHVSFQAIGMGLIEITDQEGKVLFSYDKTSGGLETINADIDLPAIGTYVLTATISGPINTASQEVTVVYKAVPIVPPVVPGGGTDGGGTSGGISSPSTGWMIYINGYAVPVVGVIFWAVVLALISGAIFFIVKARQRRRSNPAKP